MNALQIIQQKLKAPKSQYNSFGKYHYRNQEDILEATKPLLTETGSILTISDEIVEIGGSLFVKATVCLSHNTSEWSVSAFAMHPKEQKGMNESQITGAASSYARKYALNGLFLIDDTKDADATNDHNKGAKPKDVPPKPKEELTPTHKSWEYAKKRVSDGVAIAEIEKTFIISEENKKKLNGIK